MITRSRLASAGVKLRAALAHGDGRADSVRRVRLAVDRTGAARRRPLVTGLLALAATVVAGMALTSAPAFAATGYVSSGSFGSAGSGDSGFQSPAGVAVDQSTGDVYAADAGNFRIEKFSSTGTFLAAWGWGVTDGTAQSEVCTSGCETGIQGSGAGQFSNPIAIAVDNSAGPSAGDVYVADQGNTAVEKFNSSGTYLSSIAAASGDPFSTVVGVATDPTGNVWVSAPGSAANVEEFDGSATNAPITQWNAGFSFFSTSGPPFTVDANDNVYAPIFGGTHVFSSSGTHLGNLDPSNSNVTALSTDLAAGKVFSAQGSFVAVYAATSTPPESPLTTFGQGTITSATGVGVDSASGSVYVADGSANQVDIFAAVILPDVTTGQATGVQPTSATLNGTVNPDGTTLTGCKVEYVDAAGYNPAAVNPYQGGGTASCSSTPSGSTPVPASAAVSGLQDGTTYDFRLDASNTNGESTGQNQQFTTPAPPSIDSAATQNLTPTSADLTAQINPNLGDTTYHFQYGTSTGYGTSIPVPDADIGSGATDVAVTQHLTGLSANTEYHWRVVATNVAGTTTGVDHTFVYPTGGRGLPDSRAYEMVTPVQSDSEAWIRSGSFAGIQASTSGNQLTYPVHGPFSGATTSGTNYLATRGMSAWTSQVLDPQQAPAPNLLCTVAFEYSLDLSRAAVMVPESPGACNGETSPLVAGEPQGVNNLFLRDNTTGSYQLVSLNPVLGAPAPAEFQGASADFSHVVFAESAQLTSDAPIATNPLSYQNLYEWSGGTVSLVTLVPASGTSCTGSACTPVAGSLADFSSPVNAFNAVSSDGSNIYFLYRGNLYLRQNGTSTVQVDAPASGAPGPGGGSQFAGASADGSLVFFTDDASAGLTSDTVPGSGANLYRYDVNTGTLTDLTPGLHVSVDAVVGAASDGSYVYFVAEGDLAAGASSGQENLFVFHAGSTKFIATLSLSDSNDWTGSGTSRVTPDGTHLAFDSVNSLTGFDNTDANTGQPDNEVFLYDAQAAALVCASCNPSGARPIGSSTITPREGSFSRQRNLSDSGSRLFFDSSDALVPQDTNGKQDVYAYEGGQVRLISTGTSNDDSFFFDASPSGNDVFFATRQALVSQDLRDGYVVYDARVGGGFPASAPPPSCQGDGCKPPPSTLPLPPVTASVTFFGPGNVLAGAPPAKVKVLSRIVHGSTFFVRVEVPGRGRIAITGDGIRRVSRSVAKAGTYKLRVTLTRKAKKALARKRKLRLRLRVAYVPASGQAQAVSVSLTVKPAIKPAIKPKRARSSRAATTNRRASR